MNIINLGVKPIIAYLRKFEALNVKIPPAPLYYSHYFLGNQNKSILNGMNISWVNITLFTLVLSPKSIFAPLF